MLQRIREARQNESGFTLIELLIVIVVLGILAGIVVFGVGTFRTDSQTAACKADVKTVGVAADAFDAATGAYPANVAALLTAKYIKATPATTVAIDATAKTSSASCGGATFTA